MSYSQSTLLMTLHCAQAGLKWWGRDAAIRFAAKRLNLNYATARRCVTIARQCTAAQVDELREQCGG